MSKSKAPKGTSSSKDMQETLVEISAAGMQAVVGDPAGAAITLGTIFGKRILRYWHDQSKPTEEPIALDGNKPSPFVVIGLGRCGSHITAELADIVSSFARHREQNIAKRSSKRDPKQEVKQDDQASKLDTHSTNQDRSKTIGRFDRFVRLWVTWEDSSPPLYVVPIMLIGDIDKTTYVDIEGILIDQSTKIFRLDYSSLAVGGAGNVPLFAQYLTRGLLAIPPSSPAAKIPPSERWLDARQFLVNLASKRTRLVFYTFSTGGGTGSGSSLEVMRAQRYSLIRSDKRAPQIYFSAIAALPADSKNVIQLINTGRCIMHYLSALNIKLEDARSYNCSPDFIGEPITDSEAKPSKPAQTEVMLPWDGMALVSNEIMSPDGESAWTREKAIDCSNRYIAQQMFNLASSQLAAAEFQHTEERRVLTKQNYQSSRLDPQDLKTGLVGPYAVCFATSQDISNESKLDMLFLQAIAPPNVMAEDLIEGISVCPEISKDSYGKKIKIIMESLKTNKENKEKSLTILERSMFGDLCKLPLFRSCPRLIYVLTVPQDAHVLDKIQNRLSDLISWLFPNVIQGRYAFPRGTTQSFTLSIYIESSVVLCPQVQHAITNYIKLCWPQTRHLTSEQFTTKYMELIKKAPPISDNEIQDFLGEREDYSFQIPNFSNTITELQGKWREYVNSSSLPAAQKGLFGNSYDFEDISLTYKEIAAAIRYINYVYHVMPPQMIKPFEIS